MADFSKLKQRRFDNENYHAYFKNGKTIRFAIDPSKPILPLRFPEISDIAINSVCLAGCKFCYVSATKHGKNFEHVIDKIKEVYGPMSESERPFQIAIGGAGEPTMHPDFCEILKTFYDLGIMPNYTTNGMHLSQEILSATKQYCGGVAISCHPHLEKIWRPAICKYTDAGISTCLHIIVGENNSSKNFWRIYDSTEKIHYYVALPYQVAGRAKFVDTDQEWREFFKELSSRGVSDISFGALFYDWFLKNPEVLHDINVSLYEPEVLSGYRIFDDTYNTLRKSSYDLSPKFL